MTAAALDALDAWREIGEHITSENGWDFLERFNSIERAKREGRIAGASAIGHAHDDDSLFPDSLMKALARSDIYSARGDTVDLVTAAADTVPYHPILAGDELPSEFGFVRMLKPVSVVDIHDRTIRIHAVQWWPNALQLVSPDGPTTLRSAAVAYAAWSRNDDSEDDVSNMMPTAKAKLGNWILSFSGIYPADQAAFDDLGGGDGPLANLKASEEDWAEHAKMQRWLLSWWMIVKEQMIEVSEEVAPRSARRRLARAAGRNDYEPAAVKVVDLRRRDRAPSAPAGPGVDWSHRWLVRPHWRRQWYPSTQQHKLKLINGYVKGPDDKPLVARPTVFDIRPPKD